MLNVLGFGSRDSKIKARKWKNETRQRELWNACQNDHWEWKVRQRKTGNLSATKKFNTSSHTILQFWHFVFGQIQEQQ